MTRGSGLADMRNRTQLFEPNGWRTHPSYLAAGTRPKLDVRTYPGRRPHAPTTVASVHTAFTERMASTRRCSSVSSPSSSSVAAPDATIAGLSARTTPTAYAGATRLPGDE